MVASLYRNHIVVVGVGKVGYQIIKGLLALRETVVAVEKAERLAALGRPFRPGRADYPGKRAAGGPGAGRCARGQRGHHGDERRPDQPRRRTDRARPEPEGPDRSPPVRRVAGGQGAGAFTIPTISTSQVAAPAFIAAATGRKVYQEFRLAGQLLHLTDLTIARRHPRRLDRRRGPGRNRINIVMHQARGRQHQPRTRDGARARRHDPGDRPDGGAYDARVDESAHRNLRRRRQKAQRYAISHQPSPRWL